MIHIINKPGRCALNTNYFYIYLPKNSSHQNLFVLWLTWRCHPSGTSGPPCYSPRYLVYCGDRCAARLSGSCGAGCRSPHSIWLVGFHCSWHTQWRNKYRWQGCPQTCSSVKSCACLIIRECPNHHIFYFLVCDSCPSVIYSLYVIVQNDIESFQT